MRKNVIYTRYAGKVMGNYDVKCLRDLTDKVDHVLLADLGLATYVGRLRLRLARSPCGPGARPLLGCPSA